MTAKSKKLLLDTIEMFSLIPLEERESKVNFVKKQLSYVDNPNCFFEPDNDFIVAGRIFLRIANKIPFI